MRRLTLARRVTAMVTIGSLLLIAGLALLVGVTGRYDRAVDDLLNRIGPSRRVSSELLTILVEEQNAVRGYALSGDPSRRATFRTAVDREDDTFRTLRDAALGDDVTAELDRTIALVTRWRTEGAEPLLTAVNGGGPRSATDPAYQNEERLFTPMLARARRLVAVIDAHRTAAVAGLAAYRRTELITLLAATLVTIAAGAATLLLVRRWVIRPVERLAGDARVVADGELEHRVGIPSGPPELAAMAGDVERMRSRIVRDLAEVRTSRRALAGYRDRLERQAEELRRSNRDLEQFAYVASHDLQEPLRKVAGFCQLLQRRYGDKLDDRAVQYIDFAVDGAQRMQRLIGDLLAFSRVGRGGRTSTEVDLDAMAREIAESLREESHTEPDTATAGTAPSGEEAGEKAADETGRSLTPEFEIGPLPRVHGDEALLRQLMTNLMGNAVKFARPNLAARVRIDARPGPDAGGWSIAVADDGIGINPEFADRVFVIFQRLHARDAYPGTGIGLALAKRIVEHHGGRIWLDTGRTDGTTISFSLPPEEHEQPDQQEPSDQPEPTDRHEAGDQPEQRREPGRTDNRDQPLAAGGQP